MADVTLKKKYLLLNWILLASYGFILLFALYSSIYCWPTQGSVIWFLLIIFCPPFLYHGVFTGYTLIFNKLPHWKKSYRFITLVVGFFLAGGLLQITQSQSLSRFKTAYAPLIAQVHAKMPQPCHGDYFDIPQVQNYNASVTQKILTQGKPMAALFYNSQRFVVYFRAGSVDAGGSTLFYDSDSKSWRFFHHSDVQATDNFRFRVHKLTKCSQF